MVPAVSFTAGVPVISPVLVVNVRPGGSAGLMPQEVASPPVFEKMMLLNGFWPLVMLYCVDEAGLVIEGAMLFTVSVIVSVYEPLYALAVIE